MLKRSDYIKYVCAYIHFKKLSTAIKLIITAKKAAFDAARLTWNTVSTRKKKRMKRAWMNTTGVEFENRIKHATDARYDARIAVLQHAKRSALAPLKFYSGSGSLEYRSFRVVGYWYDNGSIQDISWYDGESRHRTHGPAEIMWHDNGTVKSMRWYVNNRQRRTDGPSLLSDSEVTFNWAII